jgi:hypothetical protein
MVLEQQEVLAAPQAVLKLDFVGANRVDARQPLRGVVVEGGQHQPSLIEVWSDGGDHGSRLLKMRNGQQADLVEGRSVPRIEHTINATVAMAIEALPARSVDNLC